MVDHSVEADTASPRVCAQFSEDLVKLGTDYAPFVSVDGQAPKAVEDASGLPAAGGTAQSSARHASA